MSGDPNLSGSIRILELNLADALQELFNRKEAPVVIKATEPRLAGLTAQIFDALEKRAVIGDRNELFAQNTLTLFQTEKKIVYDNSVAGRDVFVILDYALPDREKVSAEFFLLAKILGTDAYISLAQMAAQAARKNGAEHVHLIMPDYAYARQDKDHKERAPISAELTAQNLEPYFDSITSVHLHAPAIKGMVHKIPLNEVSPNEIYAPKFVCRDPVTHEPIPLDQLTKEGVNALFKSICIVSPDAGGAENARSFAKYCKTFAATILNVAEKEIPDICMAQIDKRRPSANASEVVNVLGRENIAGHTAIIIDDMGDTFGTGTHAADALIKEGAARIEFWGTHGYFSGPALTRIHGSKIAKVNITNSRALQSEVRRDPRIDVTDISPILAQVIIDQITKPAPNIEVRQRHLESNDEHRRALGRHVFTMMPPAGAAAP
jgi:ribose-phosphate pyrophosphokinase